MKTSFNKKYLALIAALILIIAVIFYLVSLNQKPGQALVKVEKEDIIQRVSLYGLVQPAHKALIIAPYNGYVKKIFVKVGQKVKVGDPLVSIVQSLSNFEQNFPLRSPLSGVVVQVRKTEGERISTDGADFVIRVDDTSTMLASVNAAEIERVQIKEDQDATLKPMALGKKTYHAKVTSLSLASNEKDRWDRSSVVEFPVTLIITDADSDLKSGMTSIIEIITNKKEKVLALKHEFILSENEETFVIGKNGKRIKIKTGMANEEKVEILEGLKEGDEVQKIDFTSLMESP